MDLTADGKHTWLDDIQALITGALAVSVGVLFMKSAGLLTGGTTGLAFLFHYASDYNFGVTLFLVNLPFYLLGIIRMGWRFTLKTVFTVFLVAVMTEFIPLLLVLESIEPLFASIGGGLLIGTGLLIIIRHKASLGGFNILVLFIQERFGFPAGKVQMVMDSLIVLSGFWLLPPYLVFVSVVGAIVLNFVLAVNHKPGRYTGY